MALREVDPKRLLTSHVIFRCGDIEAFHAYVTSMEGRHRRHVAGEGPLEIELRHAPLGPIDLGLVYASVGMSIDAKRESSKPFYVQFPFSGNVRVEIDGKKHVVGPGGGLIISPLGRTRRESEPGWTLSVVLDATFVRLRLKDRLGRMPAEPLAFEPVITDAAQTLRDYCLLIIHAIDHDLMAPGVAVAEVMANGLVDLLLDLQPHSCSEALRDARAAAKSARIKAVADYLEDHLDEPLRIKTLAGVAGCSIRSLQAMFLEHCGSTPMEFVRRRRLARAREQLETGARATTVTQVALSSGFTHLGKFSQIYAAYYGERPSETLRRAISRAASQMLP